MSAEKGDTPKPAEKPFSLHPLKFEQAVEKLLKVRPEEKQKRGQPARKKKAARRRKPT